MASVLGITFLVFSLLLINTPIIILASISKGNSPDCVDIGGGSSGSSVNVSIGVTITLQPDLYSVSCPEAEDIIFSVVSQAVAGDPRMAASLLRLHFHDCFVNGCDASVLLDDTPRFTGEKTAPPNVNSLRGFDVIDSIKSQLELACPETVSCADILAVAARDSVVISGGPGWDVEMGRRDGLSAFPRLTTNIPAPTSNVATLIRSFQKIGLSKKDMVALSGGHTIGKARCSTFASRLSGSQGTDLVFQQSLRQLCSGGGNSTLTQLDLATPATFDNQYYINLLSGQGLLPSDQTLVTGGAADISDLVKTYAADVSTFFEDFKDAMLSMGRLPPAANTAGEIRKNCRAVN